MNENAILHYPESKYCFALNRNTVCLRLRIAREDAPEMIEVVYGAKYTYAIERKTKIMQRHYEDRLYAYYTAYITLDDVRMVYVFSIKDEGKILYFSEDGLTDKFDFELSYYNSFQYSYINEIDVFKPVDWMKNAIFYQIFVDRFKCDDAKKDACYVNLKWGEKPAPKSFAGGDLQGIIQKLDYLSDLGVNTLYLTPVFKSESNHKYDISDYYEIDEHFGNKKLFRTLIEKAHLRGMRVVLDAVFNHCSDKLSQFQNVLKYKRKSKYYNWFIINSDVPFTYECFASCDYMPKLNTSNAEVQKFLVDIGCYWIKEFDIDGWRLDVSDEVSHDFWRLFRKKIKALKSDCILIGENWHDANKFLQGDEFDGIMNYAFTKACLDFYAFDAFTPKQFSDKLNEILMRNTDTANLMMLNFCDSHDVERFLTRVNGDVNKLMSAIALTYFYVGAPCIYYGTEIAMEGGYDPDNRRCMDWDKAKDKSAIKTEIKILSSMKHRGDFSDAEIKIYSNNGLVILEREKYRLILNQSKGDIDYNAQNAILCNAYDDFKLKNCGFILEDISTGR